ncbi:hypothetical protein [Saccharopolyspora sp.]|uniref:DUF7144 family membrane protein n=1 Tax=Saccharopolyspora sp. TaxID=33915 RepID=UPI0025D783AE|nr:hypothetical protein [Saccharopolyspora sp.]
MAQLGHRGFHAVGRPAGGLADGLALFASVLMVIIGVFHVIVSTAVLLQGPVYAVTGDYVFSYNVGAWGWAHLGLGVLVAATGLALLGGAAWARIAGIVIVALSALGNFLFIPHQPLWSLLIIAVDVAVIWALAVHGRASLDSDTE